MPMNEVVVGTFRPRTGLRPVTGCPELDRTLAVRTLGQKRLAAAQIMARTRPNATHPEWYHGEGDIKVVGEFDLGKKGGKWADAVPMVVTRPGRETTPLASVRSGGKQRTPGRVKGDEYAVTTRRLCGKLSNHDRIHAFAQFGGLSVGHPDNEGFGERELPPGGNTPAYQAAVMHLSRQHSPLAHRLLQIAAARR